MQKVYNNFQDNIDSFQAARGLVGLFQPGRYKGFDRLYPTSALGLNMDHAGATYSPDYVSTGGWPQVKIDQTLSAPTGTIISNQGCIIQDDGTIGLTFITNAGNGSYRTDLVVCDHAYVATIGGAAATYSVIRGPLGSNTFPALPDPKRQVVIAVVVIAPNISDLRNVGAFTYYPTVVPDLGGRNPVLGNPQLSQTFSKLVGTNLWGGHQLRLSQDANAHVTASAGGLFYLNPNAAGGDLLVWNNPGNISIHAISKIPNWDANYNQRIIVYNRSAINQGIMSFYLDIVDATLTTNGTQKIKSDYLKNLVPDPAVPIAAVTVMPGEFIEFEQIEGYWQIVNAPGYIARLMTNLRKHVEKDWTVISNAYNAGFSLSYGNAPTSYISAPNNANQVGIQLEYKVIGSTLLTRMQLNVQSSIPNGTNQIFISYPISAAGFTPKPNLILNHPFALSDGSCGVINKQIINSRVALSWFVPSGKSFTGSSFLNIFSALLTTGVQ